ncbi:MAG: DUF1801 domain-containing protein [Actinomycetota bacterium]|nr:DUF1801 domain-containing protein [Actinomycetota bacterium]
MAAKFATIDEYISALPDDVAAIVEEIRRVIRAAVPDAGERISYQMPTMTLDGGSLVHFAAWKHHIGLYPLPAADDALTQDLAPYNTGKGTARFPLDQPIPYDLIARVAAQLVVQREERDS